jgi:uncharacterized protein YndB with AHSA1/START domain
VSEVIVTRWIAASPPTVFAFFTDSERWAAWQGVAEQSMREPAGNCG